MKNKRKAFSVAEAFIVLLIGSIALGMSAPMITKQIKAQNMTDTQFQVLQRQIEELRRNQSDVEDDAVMFYASDSCPENWAKLDDFGGYYLRIQNTGETIGSIKEQMVHKHKHVSPLIQALDSSAYVNAFRYGPFRNDHSRAAGGSSGQSVFGDMEYPNFKSKRGNEAGENATDYNITSSASYLLRSFSSSGEDFNNWYMFTSDGMNRKEYLSISGGEAVEIPICPNRSEQDGTSDVPCEKGMTYNYKAKSSGTTRTIYVNNQPYLESMPLVGEENRPNSLVLTACVKGYTTCSMVDNELNCTR